MHLTDWTNKENISTIATWIGIAILPLLIKMGIDIDQATLVAIISTIIPYFQIEQDDNSQMNLLQTKLVVMMEDLKHYHHYSSHSPFKIQSA